MKDKQAAWQACDLCSVLLNNFGGQQQRITMGLAWGQGARVEGGLKSLWALLMASSKFSSCIDHIAEAAQSSG